jgi:hypothetical protein
MKEEIKKVEIRKRQSRKRQSRKRQSPVFGALAEPLLGVSVPFPIVFSAGTGL